MSDKLREQLQAALEAGIEQFLEWLAIATGKPLRRLRRKEYQQLAAELARLLAEVLPKLEDLANNPDPATQRELAFRLFDDLAHQLDPKIPPGEDALRFYARVSHHLSAPLDGWPNDPPWQYAERHRRYRDFLWSVVASRGFDAVSAFLQEAFSGTLPQYQTLGVNRLIPPELRSPTRRMTTTAIQNQLNGWRAVAADWDKWTCIPYGLLCLAQDKPKSWQEIARVTLHDRVVALSELPNLAPLVCGGQDSVTIRNALVHGNAKFNPQTRKVEFEAANKSPFVLPASEVRIKAIDMALSNYAISLSFLLAVDTLFDRIRPDGAPAD